jgi:hypothetical protein
VALRQLPSEHDLERIVAISKGVLETVELIRRVYEDIEAAIEARTGQPANGQLISDEDLKFLQWFSSLDCEVSE